MQEQANISWHMWLSGATVSVTMMLTTMHDGDNDGGDGGDDDDDGGGGADGGNNHVLASCVYSTMPLPAQQQYNLSFSSWSSCWLLFYLSSV